MRIWVERDEVDLRWRWGCDCGQKGHWQDLSYSNSAVAAKNHFHNVHWLRNVITNVQFARGSASGE